MCFELPTETQVLLLFLMAYKHICRKLETLAKKKFDITSVHWLLELFYNVLIFTTLNVEAVKLPILRQSPVLNPFKPGVP